MLDINPNLSRGGHILKDSSPNDEDINKTARFVKSDINAARNRSSDRSETLEFLAKEEDNSKLIFTFTVVVAAIVIGAIGYLYYVKSSKNQQLVTKQRENEELNLQLKDPTLANIELTATRYTGGLASLNSLFASDLRYSEILSAFERITPNEIVFQGFSIDAKNQIKISASANSLDDSAKFIKSLKSSDFLSGVMLESDSQSSTGGTATYSLSVSATLLPNVLIKEVINAGS